MLVFNGTFLNSDGDNYLNHLDLFRLLWKLGSSCHHLGIILGDAAVIILGWVAVIVVISEHLEGSRAGRDVEITLDLVQLLITQQYPMQLTTHTDLQTQSPLIHGNHSSRNLIRC